MVQKPTRHQYNSVRGQTSSSCIDHVYTNYKFRCSKISTFSFGNSDHDLLSYVRFSKEPPAPTRTIRKRSYKNFCAEKFLSDLKLVDWSWVYSCQDVDDSVYWFTHLFKIVLDQHAPWISFQQRQKFAPWVTKDTIKIMNERNTAKSRVSQLCKEGQDASGAGSTYKQLRNKVNNRLKYEEKQFKMQKLSESLGSPSACWHRAKSYMNWNNSTGPPSQLLDKGILISKAASIASTMNEFFIEKVQTIRAGIKSLPNEFKICHEIMSHRKISLDINHVSVTHVKKILKKSKGSKSTGIDTLDSYSVKLSAEIIAQPLHHIICLAIMQSKFPSSWKYSKVIPLHKKESKLEKKNYRPVTILSPLSKIFERIIYDQMYNYFSRNRILNKNLHGFRSNRSTQTALLTMYDRWATAASNGQMSGVVLIDLSAAFDLVDHQLLLSKLKIYGVKGDLLRLIESYLSDRFQSVWIDHVLSSFLPCDIGVPQGSILGPLFFVIFANDLIDSIESHADAYADDTTVTASGSTVREIENQLSKDCSLVTDWMRSNLLKLNADKSSILTMGTQRRLLNKDKSLEVEMNGVVLTETQSETLLGCTIQANLKWNGQVSALSKKLASRLNALSKLQYCCPYVLRKSIAECIFNSLLIYCLPVFGGLDKSSIQDLQKLQNRAARIVCQAPVFAKRSTLFEKLGWLTVNQLISYHTVMAIQKIRVEKEPEYLAQFLTNDSRNSRIIVPNQMLNIAYKSFCYRGSALWNLLPYDLRKENKTGQFRNRTRKWIKSNVKQFLD